MPTYDFQCKKCDKIFEKYLSFKEVDSTNLVVSCPCGSVETARQLSCGIMFFDSDPKTVGSLAERNYSRLGEASKAKIMQEKSNSAKELEKISPNAKKVIKTPKELRTKWPKLSKKAISKMNVNDYINSSCEPKEM